MQRSSTFPDTAHIASHAPILPAAQPMAEAYSNATASAHTTSANGQRNDEGRPLGGPLQPTSSASVKRKSSSSGKRKRASGTDDSTDNQSAPTKSRDGPKKKKAARACFHCQKAHLTCDDARPCQRCLKRGMADQCIEGHRKKAKYLLDESELDALKSSSSKSKPQAVRTDSQPQVTTPKSASAQPYSASTDSIFSVPFDPSYSFGSEAANLEYSSLSALLGLQGYGPDASYMAPESAPSNQTGFGTQQFVNSSWPAEPPQQQQQQIITPQPYSAGPVSSNNFDLAFSSPQNGSFVNQQQYVAPPFATPAGDQLQAQMPAPMNPGSLNRYPTPELAYPSLSPQQSQTFSQQPARPLGQPALPRRGTPSSQSAPSIVNLPSTQSTSSLVSPPASDSPVSASSPFDSAAANGAATWKNPRAEGNAPAEQPSTVSLASRGVYHTVTQAYDYTESYHFLMKFLSTRFGKNDILRVIRALAIYRPSIISLQSSMSDDDFLFMEKCLRRSLVELEKLISFSGTPTVVWRRTGEILLVGAEFCLLTEWKMDELLTGRKYIYELFENQSIIEYWEKFASHAFENTTQSVYSHCVLLKPSGEPVPCTFCLSIRRDIFDLPSVVIGQWLPLV